MDAILDEIEKHPLFDRSVYGTHNHMKAQWIGHNIAHDHATGSGMQKSIISLLLQSDVETIEKSSQELDLRPYGNFTKRQELMYTTIEGLLTLE